MDDHISKRRMLKQTRKRIDSFVKAGDQYINLTDFPLSNKRNHLLEKVMWFVVGILVGMMLADYIIRGAIL